MIQTARIVPLFSGNGYGFETSIQGSRYNFDINLPTKSTKTEAEQWIVANGWQLKEVA